VTEPSRCVPGFESIPTQRAASRRRFLRAATASAGVIVAGGSAATVLTRGAASAPSPTQDARILNFVLALEYLEAAFYGDAKAQGKLRGELSEFARIVGGHENAHVVFLRKALGSNAGARPRFRFGRATQDERRFVNAAVMLEDLSVSAYNGQAANLTPAALAAAAKIVSVEARHAAWIRDIAGKPPAAHPTDPALTAAEVCAAVKKTGFIVK
jgi:Ferritin-like domain